MKVSRGGRKGGQVHVYGPPEETALYPGECLCTDVEADECEVVYHLNPVGVGAAWTCRDCLIDSGTLGLA